MKIQKSIGIVTIPIEKSGLASLSDIVDILYSLFGTVFLITGDAGYDYNKANSKVKICRISHRETAFFLTRILFYIIIQVKISWYIVKKSKNIDILLFYFGGDTLVLPAITAWLLRKKIILLFAGSSIKTYESKKDRLSFGLMIIQFVTFLFVDKIILYSNNIIKDYALERWHRKIAVAQQYIVNHNVFKIKNNYSARESIVGYCGRFGEEKGILKLIYAIPEVFNKNPEIKFLIIGDGVLKKPIERYIMDNHLSNQIILPGWIDHIFLPDYLNLMKLLIIPSDTEGLPYILLEAMICGTPVLATPVGAIPDIIKDDETGFIMRDNSPECIAENIIRAMSSKDLGKISENGRSFVEENFTFERTVESWKNLLNTL